MNFRTLGIIVFLIGAMIAGWGAYQWNHYDRVETGAALSALMAGPYSLTRGEAALEGEEARAEQKKLPPWIIGGSALGLLGLGMAFAARGQGGPTRTCTRCAETIKLNAVICKHCGSEVAPLAEEQPYSADEDDDPDRRYSYRALAKAAEKAERKARR